MAYEIEIDQEIAINDITYSVFVEAELEFRNEEDPECCGVEITKAEIAPLDGDLLPLEYEGRQIEKVIVVGNPTLTELVDQALWDAVRRYTEDNYGDIMRDLRNARDDHWL